MKRQILLVGEPMGLLMAQSGGKLEEVTGYSLAVAGAEFNVAIGLARLGHSVTYLTKLGEDPFGRMISTALAKNGIRNDSVVFSGQHPTGFMLKSLVEEGDPDIFYYRKGSAASTLAPEDVERVPFEEYSHLHLTGIFPALSPTTLDASQALIDKARAHNLSITFDPNLRPQLWGSKEEMVQAINHIAVQADIVMPGEAEGEILTGATTLEGIIAFYLERGVQAVVIKQGGTGALVGTKEGVTPVPGFPVDKVVDTVGAGDGFAAGFISALQEGKSLAEAVQRGNGVGAIQVTCRGDNEGLPTRAELAEFMQLTQL